jgi:phosphate/sulfate permease
MITADSPKIDIDLKPFRRRILFLRIWQRSAIGACAGAAIAIAAFIGDRADLWEATVPLVASAIVAGIVLGALSGLLGSYSDVDIARSIDRRSNLEDRLATVFEYSDSKSDEAGSFISATATQTGPKLAAIRAAQLYQYRLYKTHALFLVLLVICSFLYLFVDTTLLMPGSTKIDAAKLKKAAVLVQQIAKPVLDQADRPDATAGEKQLAKDIRKFVHDLQRAHITKQEALIRANELADQARQLEQNRNLALGQSLKNAQTAGAKLQQMMQSAAMQKSDAAKMAEQASALEKKMAALQDQLDAARSGKTNLSKSEIAKLSKQLADMQHELQQIQLSEQAAEMLGKLQSMKAYQQAMQLLSRLQAESDLRQQGQGQMSAEQMKAIADQLDQLAKEMNTDAKLKAYAQSLLDAAKAARANDAAGVSAALEGAFSLSERDDKDAPPDMGGNGTGSTSPGTWVGDHGKLNLSNKSSLLHIKFKDRYITSQKGRNGSETYTEMLGPAHLDVKSDIPYQDMLPKYEKTEESALSKGEIPPEMRTKVRDYFDSLHQAEPAP